MLFWVYWYVVYVWKVVFVFFFTCQLGELVKATRAYRELIMPLCEHDFKSFFHDKNVVCYVLLFFGCDGAARIS